MDSETASSHRLWNGFIGHAGQARLAVRRVAMDVLSGTIADYQPSKLRCSRRAGVTSPVLVYETDPEVTLSLRLDPKTGLPAEALIRGTAGASVSVTAIRYAQEEKRAVPVTWVEDGARFTFDRVSVGEATAAHESRVDESSSPPSVSIPMVRNEREPQSRGVVVTVRGHRLRMLLDSGASTTVINMKYATTLDLQPVLGAFVTEAGGYSAVKVARARDIAVGRFHLHDVPVVLASDTSHYDGIIGLDFFALGRVSFSRDALRIARSKRAGDERSSAIDTYDGVPIAEAAIQRRRSQMLIDSGAAFTALLPARFSSQGHLTGGPETSCHIGRQSIWGYPKPFAIDGVRIGGTQLTLQGCLSPVDEVVPNRSFTVIGFPTIMRHLRAIDYRSGEMLFL